MCINLTAYQHTWRQLHRREVSQAEYIVGDAAEGDVEQPELRVHERKGNTVLFPSLVPKATSGCTSPSKYKATMSRDHCTLIFHKEIFHLRPLG